MKKGDSQYGIWQINPESEDPDEDGYWELHDSLSDAVGTASGDPVEIFLIQPRSIGCWKRVRQNIRVKKRKPRKKSTK